jgi:hypothetical protein
MLLFSNSNWQFINNVGLEIPFICSSTCPTEHVEQRGDFFNESLLQAPQYDLPKEGNINPGEVKFITDLITYDPDEELEVENVSGGILEFGFSFDKKTIVGNTITLASIGKEIMRVGNSGVQATNVMVRSQGTLVGSYRVDRA